VLAVKYIPTKLPDSSNELMTVVELAKLLRVHRSTVYRLAESGEIPAFRGGNNGWRFGSDEIDRWRFRNDDGDWRVAVPHRYGAGRRS